MKKIKMLKGGYGLADKSGRVSLKTVDDEPFDAPDKDADMLVEGGFAEFVGKQRKKTKPETPKEEIEIPQEDPEEIPTEEPETEETEEQESEEAAVVDEMDIESMTLAQLQDLADDLGVEYKKRDKKDDLIAKIEAAAPPSLDPQEVEG